MKSLQLKFKSSSFVKFCLLKPYLCHIRISLRGDELLCNSCFRKLNTYANPPNLLKLLQLLSHLNH